MKGRWTFVRKFTKSAAALLILLAVAFAAAVGCSQKAKGVGGQGSISEMAPAKPKEAPSADQAAKQTKITVFSPCAFAKAATKIAKLFEQKHPDVEVTVMVENVGTLVPRIERGAKPEVFMCIGDHEVDELEKKGLVDYAADFCYTSLVLIVPRANPAKVRTLADLAKPEVKTIALADEARSAGYYARKLLEENGLWKKVEHKLVRPRFPVELLKLASKGKVQASIAYGACFRSEEGEKKQLSANLKLIEDFQAEHCQVIACRAAVIKGAAHPDLGREFIDFLTEDECQKIFAAGGFMTLSEPKCYPSQHETEKGEGQ